MDSSTPATPAYTCSDYRQEMTLLSLQRALQQTDPDSREHRKILAEIAKLEKEMDM